MKKIIIAVCAAMLCIFAAGMTVWLFGYPGGVKIDYNNCSVYSEADIDSAARVIIDRVDAMEGCVLFSLKYSTSDELEYCQSLNKAADYEECIVFDSVFRSPIKGGGAWEVNEIYTWDWCLAREKGGQWELVTYGYA